MKTTGMLFVILLCAGVSVSAFAQQKKPKKDGAKDTVITGEIVDVKCYLTGMMGGRGEDHKQCAVDCINGGLPVGILDSRTERVYIVVPKKGMEGANKTLVQYAAQKVKLTGAVVEKGGSRLFIYTNVEEAK